MSAARQLLWCSSLPSEQPQPNHDHHMGSNPTLSALHLRLMTFCIFWRDLNQTEVQLLNSIQQCLLKGTEGPP